MLDNLKQALDGRVNHWVHQYDRHVNPTFMKLLNTLGFGRVYVRASDVLLWDSQEREYLDALAGFGSVNLGHNHPRLLQRLQAFMQSEPLHFCHVGPSQYQAALAEALATRLPGELAMSLFANSGAEAVEIAMKIAHRVNGRNRFVYCRGGFHGTNLGVLSLMGAKRMRQPFESLLAQHKAIPFNDLNALENSLKQEKIAAFIVEPIQAEAGVVLPEPDYLLQAQALCRQYGALFVLDEIQTGMDRTGSFVRASELGLEPDVLLLGKSLGGGVTPIALAATSSALYKLAFGAMDHFDICSSTFAGNALSCVAASETLALHQDMALAQNANEQGDALRHELRQRLSGHPLVRDVRGSGLMVAIELGSSEENWFGQLSSRFMELTTRNVHGQWIARELLNAGVVCQPASHQWNVLKLTPPLTLQTEHRTRLVTAIDKVLQSYTGMGQIVKAVSAQLMRSSPDKQSEMY